jgi:hypothetical protein
MTFCVPWQKVNGSNDPEFPANGRFRGVECVAGLPRVRFRSGATQTHKPTVLTKNACK